MVRHMYIPVPVTFTAHVFWHVLTETRAVYSYGVILWELLTREGFFSEVTYMFKLEKLVIKGRRPPIPPCPEEYAALIRNCWDGDPDVRPSFRVRFIPFYV
jgi:hypothetical protein